MGKMEINILYKISQTQKDKYYVFLCVEPRFTLTYACIYVGRETKKVIVA